ncbi:MAG: leucine-rich repeat domain-containing protein [Bacteroidaceae bacterium]|nr:leucine-rich repeat domain-containing protein [Bacteroidaceae bacterium]
MKKRIKYLLYSSVAMFMFSASTAWAQYVKVISEDGTVLWEKIKGEINGRDIKIYNDSEEDDDCVIADSIAGTIDLTEVWSRRGGKGTHYQVTSIGDDAFSGCTDLISVIIPSSVTSIGDDAFSDCRSMISVTIPSGLTSIGDDAFSGCRNLSTFMRIPSSVTSINEGVFEGCSRLPFVSIPSSVTSIGAGAFEGCSRLTFVRIPSSVTSIGEWAFKDCHNLVFVRIPSSVTSFNKGVFSGCSKLALIVTEGDDSVFDAIGILDISFDGSVTIPSSITNIGDEAFEGCRSLTSVKIPSSVLSIGKEAFKNCAGLNSITSYITEVFETGKDAFQDIPSSTTLYVPKGLVCTYQSKKDWNHISNIKENVPAVSMTTSK